AVGIASAAHRGADDPVPGVVDVGLVGLVTLGVAVAVVSRVNICARQGGALVLRVVCSRLIGCCRAVGRGGEGRPVALRIQRPVLRARRAVAVSTLSGADTSTV